MTYAFATCRKTFSIPACLIIFLLLESSGRDCIAQKDLKMDALNRYEIIRSDTVYRFYAIVPPKKHKYRVEKNYYSFAEDSIITTRGAAAGRIMHGAYTLYYPDKNLMEQGNFKYGLKNGEWKTWFPGGELMQTIQWKDGIRTGKITEFDSKGNVIRSGHYKNEQFTGTVTEVSADGKPRQVRYEKGKLVEEEKKKEPTTNGHEENKKTSGQ